MNKVFTAKWWYAAFIRAIKTVAQTALSLFTIGSAFTEVDWLYVLSVAAVAGIYSLMTSIAGLPEVPDEVAVPDEPDEAVDTDDAEVFDDDGDGRGD